MNVYTLAEAHFKVLQFSYAEADSRPATSTPVKARRRLACQFNRQANTDRDDNSRGGTKHDLTPGSKQNPNQPKSKRFLVGKFYSH